MGKRDLATYYFYPVLICSFLVTNLHTAGQECVVTEQTLVPSGDLIGLVNHSETPVLTNDNLLIVGDGSRIGGEDDCCYGHDSPSCENMACATEICDAFPECCTEEWGVFCASAAASPVYSSCTCSSSGSAIIYRREGEQWLVQDGISGTAPFEAAIDRFGTSVDYDNGRIVVGDPQDNYGECLLGGLSCRGNGYVFLRNDNGTSGDQTDDFWELEEKLEGSNILGPVVNAFGFSTAISGNWLLFGAPQSRDLGGLVNATGAVYLFKPGGIAWIEHARLSASDEDGGERFGEAIDISGDWVVIGAPKDNGGVGSAYVFHRGASDIWSEEAKLVASDAGIGGNFGASVAIDGDYIVVGASWHLTGQVGARGGHAYVYRRVGASWIEQAILAGPDPDISIELGTSVAIDGDTVLVGAPHEGKHPALRHGSAYLFRRNDNGTPANLSDDFWVREAKYQPAIPEFDLRIGASVSVNGNLSAVGRIDQLDSRIPKVHIFENDGIDTDMDGLVDACDNCLVDPNSDQADVDDDGIGDVCDSCLVDPDNDVDMDGLCADMDNCPIDNNPGQEDLDGDSLGDACDDDRDGDGMTNDVDPCPDDPNNDTDNDNVCGDVDNCPLDANTNQGDLDNDGIGDVCDSDRDGDNIPNGDDNCPDDIENDADGDGLCGDVDLCPHRLNPGQADQDGDLVGDECDNCIDDPNADQSDLDWDGMGDACDADDDNDGNDDDFDNCPTVNNTDQLDSDGDLVGDCCDPDEPDADSDGVADQCDNCNLFNPTQSDCQGNGIGDVCEIDDGTSEDLNLNNIPDQCEAMLPVLPAMIPFDQTKDRYLSFDPSTTPGESTALRVNRVNTTSPWYVSCSLQDAGNDGLLSVLVSTAEFCEWPQELIHVRGCEIVPGNRYSVVVTLDEITFSTPLSVFTTAPQFSASRHFGDLVGSFTGGGWTAPEGLVTANDIVSVVQKFQLLASAPHISRMDTDGKTPNGIVAGNDILRAVLAFAGSDFGFGVTDCLTGTCVPSCP